MVLSVLVTASAGAEPGRQRASEGDALRRLAQSEVDSGRLSNFRVVEPYRAVGASVLVPPVQPGEKVAAVAQAFANDFCNKASMEYPWRRSSKLIVYVHGRPHPAYSCSIPVSGGRGFGGLKGSSKQDALVCDGEGAAALEPDDELD